MPTVSSSDGINETSGRAANPGRGHRDAAGAPLQCGRALDRGRPHLLPLPARPFEAARRVTVTASKMSEVRFATNRYSVPVAYALPAPRCSKLHVDTVRIYHQTTLIAEIGAAMAATRPSSDWRHYLPLLARKPGAVPFAAALRTGELLRRSSSASGKGCVRAKRMATARSVQGPGVVRAASGSADTQAVTEAVDARSLQVEPSSTC